MEKARFSGIRRRTAALALAVLAAIAASAFLTGSSGLAAVDPELPAADALPDLDVRTTSVAPSAAQLAAADQLGAEVTWNRFGTPSTVYNLDGNLATGVVAPDAVAAVRTWLDGQRALFGLGSAADLKLVRDTPLAGGDGHAVLLGQTYDGVLAAPDGLVTVAVAGNDGGGWNITFASSSLTGGDAVESSYQLSPEQAWVTAANAVGQNVSTSDVTVAGHEDGWTDLVVTGLDDTQSVRKTAFPVPGDAARPAYQTIVTDGVESGYAQTVDAASGAILARSSIVDNAVDNPTWKVFPAFPVTTPLNRFPWNYPSTDVRQTWCWTPVAGCDLAVGNVANSGNVSMPWDEINPGTSTHTTSGNAANDRELWITAAQGRPAATLFQPTSATRDYVYPFTNAWFTSGCDPNQLVDPATGQPRAGTGADISAAVTNLFAMHSRMHDFSYHLGFTESQWNGQANNFTTPPPFLGNDPVTGNAQAGAISGGYPSFAGRDNANMGTNRDGTPSVTNMFLWQPIPGSFYAPCVDGDYDMGVIGHEYGHMIENRMIGKGFRRAGSHAGAMGEAFGDFDAVEYLLESHFVPVWGVDPFVEGAYVTGNSVTGIRNYTMNWPMSGPFPAPGRNAQVDPLNLGDYGYDVPGPEVHSDGEIWIATQFTLRQLFLNRYPSQGAAVDQACLTGDRPVSACPGNRRWMQLYYDAMSLMPVGPTLLDARNAMLAADQTRFGGANQDLLWRGFAERGFGQFASTTGNTDGDPIPDFSSPLEKNATVTFRGVARDGKSVPVAAKVYVGDYEARATQIADTNPANDPAPTTPPTPTNLDDTAAFVATGDHRGDGHNLHGGRNDHGRGSDDDDDHKDRRGDDNGAGYNFIAAAPGYGAVRFRIDDLRPGENRTVTIEFPTNVASIANGSTATGDGTTQQALIDDTEGTNWSSTAGQPVQGQRVLITLGGGRQSFTALNASALIGPGQNRFTALRQFEVLACDATSRPNPNPTCDPAVSAGWKKVLTSEPDAFPSVNPRPIAPDLILRSWDVQRTTATHVLFRVLNNQCSGQTSFQGEQDNDPRFSTDCRIGAPEAGLPPRDRDVRAAELQLLTSEPKVKGADEIEPR
jgi:hypothetical protein